MAREQTLSSILESRESRRPLISVENLQTTFHSKLGPLRAVSNVSYQIFQGEILGIVGESGCGKSVLSYSLMRLIDSPGEITGGKVLFGQQDLLALSEQEMEEIRGGKMAMIFQEPMTALNPVATIGQQIDEQILRHLGNTTSKKEARERSIELLQLVGIPAAGQRYHSYPHQLSGGMRQRAMIAMALSCHPQLLIADEPTTALDVTIQGQILELIQDLQEKFKMTVQFITHDLGVISEMADRVMVMYAGHCCELAPTATLLSHPRHPYTEALLNSIPKLGHRSTRLNTIEGTVPSLHELPKGCPFNTRCPRAKERCFAERPTISAVGVDHSVACFYPVD